MAQLIRIYPENPSRRQLENVVKILEKGGLVIYPTDTVYGLGCDITNSKALERLARLKGIKLSKAEWSFICNDLSNISEYTRPMDSPTFKLLKRTLPGPYTFILEGSNNLPRDFRKKKTVGIRVPDNSIPRELVEILGRPIVSTSIHDEDEIIEYTTDPELIYEKWKDRVDAVINGGIGGNIPSTVIDVTEGEPVVIREGKGSLDLVY